jgi:hypothetical protein
MYELDREKTDQEKKVKRAEANIQKFDADLKIVSFKKRKQDKEVVTL